ncbi:hypothetical protein [Amycolatopsis sp. Hca4]|uniref:hypothetical protein n=1 Tax=Amycolatopsis sp. Hca4 TaxID=2742131 RepID=UPI0015929EBD|nr:hypothetical protein [Amycolatopsis sp. Hca4]QKV77586.1 hypothetical protein HUT10_30255 [Amycolatopsis sp. Hca4]
MELGETPEPTRDQVLHVLSDLAAGRLTAVEASDWAARWIGSDVEVEDELVFDAIQHLYGADMPVAPGKFLYGPRDFRAWLADFEAQLKP